MLLRQIFDPGLAQYAYLIGCQRSGEALVIDPQRDIDRYQTLAAENGLRIAAVAETHIHADFVSGAREFASDPAVRLYLSAEGGPDWQYGWVQGRRDTHLLRDGDEFRLGHIRVQALHTPGHTPEHLCYVITDLGGGANEPIALASGDFLFVGDVGRPDLLESAAGVAGAREPSAAQLRASLAERLAGLPDFLQILPAHGAGSACGKALGAVPTSTLGYERRFNAALKLARADGASFVREILSGQPEPPLYFATMKRINRDGPPVTGGAPRPPHLSAEEFAALAARRSTRVLDTREDRTAFDLAHVARSIQAPLRLAQFSTSAGSFLDERDPILLVVEDASEVDRAARQLYRIGFDRTVGWIRVAEAREAGLLQARIEQIDFANWDRAAAQRDGIILDVRGSAEFREGHLEGALSLPYTRLRARLGEIPAGRTLYVHCASGRRSGLAASYLRAEGYPAVHIDGDFPASDPGVVRGESGAS